MAVRLKQDRSRRSGHKHSLSAQDFPPIPQTPQLRRQRLRDAALDFLGMAKVWGEGRQSEVVARAAVRAMIDVLDREEAKP